MRTIYKESLTVTRKQFIEVHEDSKILTIQIQDGQPFVWMEVDTSKPIITLCFWLFGTGHGIPEDFKGWYVGTFQQADLVLHLYATENL